MLGLVLSRWPPGEVEERRRQLSSTGYQAYCLPIVGILCIYALRAILSTRHTTHHEPRGTKHTGSSFIHRTYRRLHWILTTTYSAEYGPVYLILLVSLHAAALVYLIIIPTISEDGQADYLHLTKALGHVAVSQLPFLYLLAVKSPTSPITVATGLTHEQLNIVHRLLAKTIYTLLCCHVALYLNLFIVWDVLVKRLKGLDVIAGLTAFFMLSVLVTLAQPIVRKRWYHAGFYRVHVLVSAVLLGAIWVHVPYTRIYVAQAAFIWIASAISRRGHGSIGWSSDAVVTCKDLGSRAGDLVEVTASIHGASGKQLWLESWAPGMHCYINRGVLGPKVPFTVVSVEIVEGVKDLINVKMVVKNLRGPTTGLLGRIAKGEKPLHCSIEGPYGEAKEYIPSLLEAGGSAGRTLIVAGGVGATYALPIYLALHKAHHRKSNGLKFIWVVKYSFDAHWGVTQLRKLNGPVDVQIIATQADDTGNGDSQKELWQDIRGLSSTQGTGRPDIRALVDSFLSGQETRTRVMVCGPTSLAQTLRTQVGRQVMTHGIHVDWHEEQFGFGGS